MGSPIQPKDYAFDTKIPLDDHSTSNEETNTWFLGSLMRNGDKLVKKYERITLLHNRITHEVTKFDERYKANKGVAAQLSEFFPKRWLSEITANFRNIDSYKLGIKSEEDRICSFLGYIELYLAFRGLTLLNSTLEEINNSLCINLTKNSVRSWKMKLLRLIPELRGQWKKIRAPTHQTAIIAAVIKVMNRELVLTHYSQEEIFHLKQKTLELTRKFAISSKARHVKNIEVWARAICLKALRDSNYISQRDDIDLVFPVLPQKTVKVIDNKRWQLDTMQLETIQLETIVVK